MWCNLWHSTDYLAFVFRILVAMVLFPYASALPACFFFSPPYYIIENPFFRFLSLSHSCHPLFSIQMVAVVARWTRCFIVAIHSLVRQHAARFSLYFFQQVNWYEQQAAAPAPAKSTNNCRAYIINFISFICSLVLLFLFARYARF